MPIVSLDKLQDAMEWVSADPYDNEAYICRQTGTIYWIAGDPGMIDEEAPEDIHDSAKYLPVPDKRDLDLGSQLAYDFASQHLPQHYNDVRDMFRRRGAYGRFKEFLEGEGLLEEWYRYGDECEAKVMGEWCTAKGFSVGP